MAMLDEMLCPTCQQTVTVAVICGRYPDECGECSEKREKEDKERAWGIEIPSFGGPYCEN